MAPGASAATLYCQMKSEDEIRNSCRITLAIGEVEECPQGACAFWEHGGAVIESACALERLQIDVRRPDLAAYLVELRGALEAARDAREREAARAAFAELVPPELSGR
jgi:hypothetical protein